ncbi:MAG TPA: exosortase A [Methylomirabilota bacterium]|jgi:exosortase|nr:exosortase A [Methylomirabilota bacterium]
MGDTISEPAELTPEGPGSEALVGRGHNLWAGLVAFIFVALLAALYSGILRDLAWQWWDDSNYTHGFLVPIFSGVLVWQRRKQLTALPAEGSWIGLLVLLLGIGILLLGDIGSENFLMRSSLIVILVGLVLFLLGPRVLRVVAFPLLFLIFMVPLPSTIFYAVALPLQTLAARNAAWTLDALGVPVLLDGNVIHLSKQSLGVAEACSGIRSLISLLSVSVGWAVLTLSGFWAVAIFVAAVVPITIVANAGRVVVTGLIGQWFGVEYAQGFFHTFSSWLVFVFAFLCLLGVHSTIRLVQARRGKRTP